jgi:hypothetical protein
LNNNVINTALLAVASHSLVLNDVYEQLLHTLSRKTHVCTRNILQRSVKQNPTGASVSLQSRFCGALLCVKEDLEGCLQAKLTSACQSFACRLQRTFD